MELKKDYDNVYNIYLTKKKEYEDAEIDYKNYIQNNRDNTFQVGSAGNWGGNQCAESCQQLGIDFPDFKSDYNMKKANNWNWDCYCSIPNLEIAKKKLNIKNQKKIESDNALALSIDLKKKLEYALQEL
jgi:hypothetical protein